MHRPATCTCENVGTTATYVTPPPIHWNRPKKITKIWTSRNFLYYKKAGNRLKKATWNTKKNPQIPTCGRRKSEFSKQEAGKIQFKTFFESKKRRKVKYWGARRRGVPRCHTPRDFTPSDARRAFIPFSPLFCMYIYMCIYIYMYI